MDVEPVISILYVLNCIPKYVAKAEVRSRTYEELLQQILHSEVTSTDTVKKAVRKVFIKLAAERDHSAQEGFIFR